MSNLSEQATPKVKDHLTFAIVSAVCFFPPTGAVAIHYARQIKGLLEKGDYQTAQLLSRKVMMLCWVTIGLGVVMTASTIAYVVRVVLPWLLQLYIDTSPPNL
jgi:hypothetical protein